MTLDKSPLLSEPHFAQLENGVSLLGCAQPKKLHLWEQSPHVPPALKGVKDPKVFHKSASLALYTGTGDTPQLHVPKLQANPGAAELLSQLRAPHKVAGMGLDDPWLERELWAQVVHGGQATRMKTGPSVASPATVPEPPDQGEERVSGSQTA